MSSPQDFQATKLARLEALVQNYGFTQVADERLADPRRDGTYNNLLTFDLLVGD